MSRPMTRDQVRSLALGRALAAAVLADPETAKAVGRRNLTKLRTLYKRGPMLRDLDEWERLLDGPVEVLADVLRSEDMRARDLRQNSPFAGLLPQERVREVKRASVSLV